MTETEDFLQSKEWQQIMALEPNQRKLLLFLLPLGRALYYTDPRILQGIPRFVQHFEDVIGQKKDPDSADLLVFRTLLEQIERWDWT